MMAQTEAKRSPLTTLCYLEKDGQYLMLHRISKLPSYKALQAEIETLIQEKNSGYNDYRAKREEYRRLQTVKGNIDQILRRSEPQRRKEQSHER